MKKLIVGAFAILMMVFSNQTQAQDYNTGIGLRAGTGLGLTVKHFLNDQAALEGLLYTRWGGILITGLYEIHKDIPEVQGLRWFYGGGAHVGAWSASNRNRPWGGDYGQSYTVVGIDGIIGLDYKFADAPINLSLDWKPAFNIIGYSGIWGGDVALSIRYTF
ncbi:hypothetical protein [Pararhodonellum marinum]|uniref:hypothetical protein n=1 Tax=Pararhodonellum marinum TaxID=2755358 RepID=UPI00188FC537|nr:hypothetical protein [Pararhodonellum marinum]